VEAALDLGYEVYVGMSRDNPEQLLCDLNIKFYDEHVYRNVLAFKDNYIAFKNLMTLLKTGDFEVIHCNTPIGGVVGRLCGKMSKVPKIIYTAHGFHFYKGAPIINCTIYKWAEVLLAHWTDAIITINNEDFQAAQKFKLRNHGKVYYVPGVGIDTDAYKNMEFNKESIKKNLKLKSDDIVCIATGDLIKRKNYESSIKAIAKTNNTNIHFLICGKGPKLEKLRKLSRDLNIENQIHFLGFRTDIKELLNISDIFLFTSYQEGLPRSLMEAMAAGLPCIASKIRGNVDLIEEGKGGYLLDSYDVEGLAKAIHDVANNEKIRDSMGKNNLQVIKKYDIEKVNVMIKDIYKEVLSSHNEGARMSR
jgi:glycosyltransferase involved in cell wall biosynthesis